jgi:uncharacterized membrane protein YphA (DoxX/SURF4 family)
MSKRYYEWSMVVLRIVVGVIFLAHGVQKFQGIEGMIQFFGSVGLPSIMVYVIATIEAIGGALLILGIFTRMAALGTSLVMLGAILKVKLGMGFINGYEFDLMLLASSISLVLSGSHSFALGNLFKSVSATSTLKKAVN